MKVEIQQKAGIAILISDKIDFKINTVISSQVALAVKNPPANARDTGDNSWEVSLEGMAIHSGVLAWRIPGQRSLAGCSVRLCNLAPRAHKRQRMTIYNDQQMNPRRHCKCKNNCKYICT